MKELNDERRMHLRAYVRPRESHPSHGLTRKSSVITLCV